MECILGIESSCDETAAAVVDGAMRVRASVVASQHDLHAEYGGVVPEIASRAHLERILPVVDRALREAGVDRCDLAAVAAGVRPGLIGSILVGASAAKGLAWALGRPFYAVDHVAAHLDAGLLRASDAPVEGPHAQVGTALGLVVSGGHTSLFALAADGSVELLGRTIDDAVGEALDKAAAMLGLPHPGGPNLERFARGGNPDFLRFPVPRLPSPLDFSLSGLKTKLLYEVRGVPQGRGAAATFARTWESLDEARRADLAASFQKAAFAQVLERLDSVADAVAPAALFVGGGVVANEVLRAGLAAWCGARAIPLVVPERAYCGDNAAMIAGHAVRRRLRGDAGDSLATPAEAVSLLARGVGPARPVRGARVQ
jgi:N6-L-threonylcarbamoyladenine synthase